ncbi:MAG: MFS transporter, partial [Oscillospiraceae bacterium]|nr:MFS transporter [Oscillospiraceae bacterium]
ERSALSVFRSIGAGVGALPAAVLLPLFVYSPNAQGEKFLDYARFFPAVCVMAIASALIFVLSYKLTREHVAPPAAAQKPELRRTLCVLLRNRPFWILCLASMLLIGLTLYMQTINGYLFKDYFKAPNLLSLYAVFTYLPMVLLLPVLGKLAHRFGKKELCAAGALLSATVNLAAFFAKIHDSGTYLIVQFISGLGMSFFTLEVWALVTDVIDHQERLSGQREEGTVYAFYSFTRKLGHTLAGSGGAWALARIGYKVAERGLPPPVQDPNAIAQMYSVATAAPAVFFLLMFALLAFAYPLSKRKLASLAQKI